MSRIHDDPKWTQSHRVSRYLSQNTLHSSAFCDKYRLHSSRGDEVTLAREYAAEVHVGEQRITIEAYGVRVVVDVKINSHEETSSVETQAGCSGSLEALVDAIRSYLPPGSIEWTSDESANGIVQVVRDGDSFSVSDREGATQTFTDQALALHAVDQAIRSLVAVDAPGLVFIHAGVVVIDGRALVLPGRSMAGKSTLVAELVRAGACYSSDEYAVLDTDCLVHPYPRRLSMREATGRREVMASELSGTVVTGPNPISVVAALEYQNGKSWAVEAMDQAAAAQVLLENAVAAQARSAEVLRAAAMVARRARSVRGVRGEAAEAIAELFAMMRT